LVVVGMLFSPKRLEVRVARSTETKDSVWLHCLLLLFAGVMTMLRARQLRLVMLLMQGG
jgi:hypothetical protein